MIKNSKHDPFEDAIDEFELNWDANSWEGIPSLLSKYRLESEEEAITELLRIDIEFRYEQGNSLEVQEYLQRFGGLLNRPDCVAQLAYEDYRMCTAKGRTLSPARWNGLPGVDETPWYREIVSGAGSAEPSAVPVRHFQSHLYENASVSDQDLQRGLRNAGFQLVQKIGEGGFSQVFLAKQNDLADRFVVLKIVPVSIAAVEPHRMAQLQHTNIVPIYSFHEVAGRSVICMPYVGRVTLSDFLTSRSEASNRVGESLVATVQARVDDTQLALQESSAGLLSGWGENLVPAADEEAVLRPLEVFRDFDRDQLATWIFQRIAGALAHSHARNVLHNDLKPSNVLIRNDGEPALLDFNLAQTLDHPSSDIAGGTLPYMSPEGFRAMMVGQSDVGPRSDVYSLGVMMYEFVTGRRPFWYPTTEADVDFEFAIKIRQDGASWQGDDSVSPGLKRIILRCLQFDPEDRYASAEQLQEDLKREHENRALANTAEPVSWKLRKWSSRNPRIVTGLQAAVVLLLLLVPLALATASLKGEVRSLSDQAMLESFSSDSADVLSMLMASPNRTSDENISMGMETLEEYELFDEEVFARLVKTTSENSAKNGAQTLLRHLGQLAFLETARLRAFYIRGDLEKADLQRLDQLLESMAQIDGAADSRAGLFLRAARARYDGDSKLATSLREQASGTDPQNDSEKYLEACRMMSEQDYAGAIERLTALADRDTVPSALRWTMLGRSQFAEGKHRDAMLSYTQSIEHAPHSAELHVLRGRCHMELRQRSRALADFNEAILLNPNHIAAWRYLGVVKDAAGDFRGAIESFDKVLQFKQDDVHALLSRAASFRDSGEQAKADSDYAAAMAANDLSVSDYVSRAKARVKTEPEMALADLREAFRRDPEKRFLQLQIARYLALYLNRESEAIDIYQRVLDEDEDNEKALVDQAVLLARAGHGDDAYGNVMQVLPNPKEVRSFYQSACVFALLRGERRHSRAITLLGRAILGGYQLSTPMDKDPDLKSLYHRDDFQAIVRAYDLGTPFKDKGDDE